MVWIRPSLGCLEFLADNCGGSGREILFPSPNVQIQGPFILTIQSFFNIVYLGLIFNIRLQHKNLNHFFLILKSFKRGLRLCFSRIFAQKFSSGNKSRRIRGADKRSVTRPYWVPLDDITMRAECMCAKCMGAKCMSAKCMSV